MSTSKVCLCIPVYHQAAKVLRCLESLRDHLSLEGIELTIGIGINGAEDSLINSINTIIKELSSIAGVRAAFANVYPTNLGKGAAVNELAKKIVNEYGLQDFVLSLDSDMVSIQDGWIPKLVQAYKVAKLYGTLGGVAVDQEGNSCHYTTGFLDLYYDSFHFYKYKGNQGVAGGGLLIPMHVWQAVKGYNAFNLYGSDDGHFAHDCAVRNWDILLSKDVRLIHPGEDNPDYAQWKVRSARNTLADQEKKGYKFI